ncbi:hypothetical protein EDB84DRAFT_1573072 [Lactarius hengduanensis]|nr:hypothetical protein EDB84DRAFT_1573072 [Lactarius hengduanensis]
MTSWVVSARRDTNQNNPSCLGFREIGSLRPGMCQSKLAKGARKCEALWNAMNGEQTTRTKGSRATDRAGPRGACNFVGRPASAGDASI